MDYLASFPEKLIALEGGNRNFHNIKANKANESWRCRTARKKFQYGRHYLDLPSLHGCQYWSIFFFYNSTTEQV